jgi:hypothetical protein
MGLSDIASTHSIYSTIYTPNIALSVRLINSEQLVYIIRHSW